MRSFIYRYKTCTYSAVNIIIFIIFLYYNIKLISKVPKIWTFGKSHIAIMITCTQKIFVIFFNRKLFPQLILCETFYHIINEKQNLLGCFRDHEHLSIEIFYTLYITEACFMSNLTGLKNKHTIFKIVRLI